MPDRAEAVQKERHIHNKSCRSCSAFPIHWFAASLALLAKTKEREGVIAHPYRPFRLRLASDVFHRPCASRLIDLAETLPSKRQMLVVSGYKFNEP